MVKKISNALKTFNGSIDNILFLHKSSQISLPLIKILNSRKDIPKEPKRIINNLVENSIKQEAFLRNSLFLNLVISMESYLKEKVVEELKSNPDALYKFLQGYEKGRKISIEDIYLGPLKFALSILENMSFHNLGKINKIYELVFGISLLKFCKKKNLDLFVKIRHLLVHNNGKVKDKTLFIRDTTFILAFDSVVELIQGFDYYERYGQKRKKFSRIWKSYDDSSKLHNWKEYKLNSLQSIFDKIEKRNENYLVI